MYSQAGPFEKPSLNPGSQTSLLSLTVLGKDVHFGHTTLELEFRTVCRSSGYVEQQQSRNWGSATNVLLVKTTYFNLILTLGLFVDVMAGSSIYDLHYTLRQLGKINEWIPAHLKKDSKPDS